MKNKSITQLNQDTATKLHNMELSEHAEHVVASTDLNIMHELFGELDTPEDVETFIYKNFPKDGTRFYIIGTDGNTHGEADTMTEAAAILEDVKTYLAKRYGETYVDDLELEIVEGR